MCRSPGFRSVARIEIVAAGVVVRVREELDVEHVAGLVEAVGRRIGRVPALRQLMVKTRLSACFA
jgi:hypothetical protein